MGDGNRTATVRGDPGLRSSAVIILSLHCPREVMMGEIHET
jgi:hypothetical protein